MLKRFIVLVLLLELSLVSGCSHDNFSITPTEPTTAPTVVETTAPTTATPTIREPAKTVTWISPGKVMVSNFHLGARAEYPMLVHNGYANNQIFDVAFQKPSYTETGYLKAPIEVQDWVIIADTTPVVSPFSTKEIQIALDMPDDVPNDIAVVYQNSELGQEYLSRVKANTILNQQLQWELMRKNLIGLSDVLAYAENLTPSSNLYQQLVLKFPYRQPEIQKAWDKTEAELQQRLVNTPHIPTLLYLEREGSITEKRLNRQILSLEEQEQLLNITTPGMNIMGDYIIIGDLRVDRWEFWVSACYTSKGDAGARIETAMATRWLITMR